MTEEQQIIDTISEVTAEMNRLNRQQEKATNLFDAYTNLINHDERESLLQTCIEFGILINGKPATKRTNVQALRNALIAARKEQLRIAEINSEFDRCCIYLSNLRNELKLLKVQEMVTLPLSTEDMLASGAMESDLHEPLEVQKPEPVQVSPQEVQARMKKRIAESSVLRQAIAVVKDLDNSQRAYCTHYAKEHNISIDLLTLNDEQVQYWITFIQNMLHMDTLTRETIVRERAFTMAIASYNQPENPQIPVTATKKSTARKVGKAVHVTSGDRIVSLVEKKPAAVKPVKEVKVKAEKKPVEKILPDCRVTSEQEAACIIWESGEYPGMSIPAGFRVRKEKATGLYRVDHWTGSHWETYINGLGKIGYTRFASELKQWLDKWQVALGIAA